MAGRRRIHPTKIKEEAAGKPLSKILSADPAFYARWSRTEVMDYIREAVKKVQDDPEFSPLDVVEALADLLNKRQLMAAELLAGEAKATASMWKEAFDMYYYGYISVVARYLKRSDLLQDNLIYKEFGLGELVSGDGKTIYDRMIVSAVLNSALGLLESHGGKTAAKRTSRKMPDPVHYVAEFYPFEFVRLVEDYKLHVHSSVKTRWEKLKKLLLA